MDVKMTEPRADAQHFKAFSGGMTEKAELIQMNRFVIRCSIAGAYAGADAGADAGAVADNTPTDNQYRHLFIFVYFTTKSKQNAEERE